MALRDYISILETAYRLDFDDLEWLQALATALFPMLEGIGGATAFTFDTSAERGIRVVDWAGHGFDTPEAEETTRQLNANAPPDELAQLFFQGHNAGTISERLQMGEAFRDHEPFARYGHPIGMVDFLGVVGINPDRRGVLIGAAYPDIHTIGEAERLDWLRVAAHLAAANRLRRRLGGADGLEDAEAILDPDDHRVEHAADEAKPHLAALQHAADRIDAARSATRRDRPSKALDLWEGLVEGRWSLVEQFDSDGRRFLVARRNDPDVAAPRRLTRRERQVVWYAARRASNELIAYELGLDPSTVGTLLHRAMHKLGVGSRVDLIQMVRALADDPEAPT